MRNFYKFFGAALVCAALTFAFLSFSPVRAAADGLLAGDAAVCTANLNANVFSDTFTTYKNFLTPFQGGGCYNPCNNSYRRCQKRSGRYNKSCRAALSRCWKACDRSFGTTNPMPAP